MDLQSGYHALNKSKSRFQTLQNLPKCIESPSPRQETVGNRSILSLAHEAIEKDLEGALRQTRERADVGRRLSDFTGSDRRKIYRVHGNAAGNTRAHRSSWYRDGAGHVSFPNIPGGTIPLSSAVRDFVDEIPRKNPISPLCVT